MNEKLIMVASIAKRLGCCKRHVYNLIRDGKLEAVRIGPRGLRVKESSYVKFVEARSVDPQSYDA